VGKRETGNFRNRRLLGHLEFEASEKASCFEVGTPSAVSFVGAAEAMKLR
jgi:hypothetical protein